MNTSRGTDYVRQIDRSPLWLALISLIAWTVFIRLIDIGTPGLFVWVVVIGFLWWLLYDQLEHQRALLAFDRFRYDHLLKEEGDYLAVQQRAKQRGFAPFDRLGKNGNISSAAVLAERWRDRLLNDLRFNRKTEATFIVAYLDFQLATIAGVVYLMYEFEAAPRYMHEALLIRLAAEWLRKQPEY